MLMELLIFCTQKSFHLSVQHKCHLVWLCITALQDWLKNSRQFVLQSEVKFKLTNRDSPRHFSNLVPRVLSLPRESTLVRASHLSARF